ncbi:unnamed protein product [Ceutorhynchus assimilis]|uniref:Spt20-like SEP domain-containing protein n=1 Tax=Ceutorhynchus assimilis TaxID=467358 RepID=A0A9N9MF46_9CUCU|nr:unnamed protein product [Ceutorhynchus assimilis]
MQSLEAACEEGEHAAKRLKTLRAASQPLTSSCFPSKEECQPSTSNCEEKPARFDLFEELRKLQESDSSSCEEEEYDSDDREEIVNSDIKFKPLILEQLVQKEKLNTIILNLYPGSKGYSLAFRFQDRHNMGYREDNEELIHTMIRGYEEDTLLNYLNREEIPPFILDALDKFDFLFYNGCVIAEVRNYRPAHPENKYYTHHVLLRPTQQTILADINTLTRDRTDFTSEDRDALESQILMAHTPNLCLEPDKNLENQISKIQNRTRVWNELPFYKITQKSSQVAANRKRKLYHFAHKDDLLEACSKAKKRRTCTTMMKSTKAVQLEEAKTVIPVPNLEAPANLTHPEHPVAINVKPMTWPEDTSDCSPHLMEEYTLETDITSKDKDKPRVYHIKLSIFQRPANLEFLGELYLDRDYKKDQRNGVACRFSLGSRPNAHRYVRQFTEIFTESGRKNARISCGLVSAAARSEAAARAQNGPSVQQQQPSVPQATPNPREQLESLSQSLQVQLNGVVQNAHPVQIVTSQHSQLVQIQQSVQKSHQMRSQELEIDAMARKLEISSQQFQAAEKAKRQQQAAAAVAAQQQKLLSNSNIISLLNSSPASNVNSDAVVNAINSASVVPQQRILARKVNTAGARVLSHSNLIALNNHNRANLQELTSSPAQTVTLSAAAINNATRVNLSNLNAQLASGQAQTVTLTPVNSAGGGSYSYTTMPVKQQVVHQRLVSSHQDGSNNSETALAALLVGTPAANRPDIASPNQANSLILEKLAANNSSSFGQTSKTSQATAQFVVQNAKTNTVISPMSSPPPQAGNTLNVQSLNLAQLQNFPGLHNVQFQLQNFSQPISLALNVGSQASQSLLMSLPNAQAQQASVTQSVQGVVLNAASSTGAGTSQLAHLVSSGNVKNITHHNIRTAGGSQTLQLRPGNPQFQLISQLQRPTRQQTIPGQTATISSRRSTPITIKMATPSNPNQFQHQPTMETIRHYQLLNQQKNLDNVFEKLKRSNNEHQ